MKSKEKPEGKTKNNFYYKESIYYSRFIETFKAKRTKVVKGIKVLSIKNIEEKNIWRNESLIDRY